MMNNLIAPSKTNLTNRQQAAQLSLAAMQADMADMRAALKNKQQANMVQKDNVKSETRKVKSANAANINALDAVQLSRVIEMAWEDRTPFEAIAHSYALNETAVIKLMRQELKPSSFRLWRRRVTSRVTKHQAKRPFDVGRAYCKSQYKPR
ncbi:TIGR03643 family protein [Psychrobacter sp. van23A]|uniref:TIGR03643 family protein n=3 Tax=Moraxellaceae TaxID=468 RepID=A0ABT9HH91_9GAMM|nr:MULTISPECIES: TIGR03643 family protein [Psychrobacter]MDP4545140.1 TIGR03643 family protein [Psychrobacter faecalis]WLW65909.1 TIGR03643 family protein [Psychrobacter sp. van23A]